MEQPTYEELLQAYQKLTFDYQNAKFEQLKSETDTMVSRIDSLLRILDSDKTTDKIKKLAQWHLCELLKKPRNARGNSKGKVKQHS